jgi:hypothetical protein
MTFPTSVAEGTNNVTLIPSPRATKMIPKISSFKRVFARGFLVELRRWGDDDVDRRGAGLVTGI